MKRSCSRSGSALLIVLGMLSFMVISAVGFASYMRYSRLPSNYLRRSASSRLLVKAALAEAIDAVDRIVGNNLHPGIGDAYTAGQYRNWWSHHVLIGTNALTDAEASMTIAPLCIEALAYLPPPLINEARYYSRRTPTATWQPLGFDSGRYVWCAVDVSDCFDINRIEANVPRSSASNRRVTFSHLFEGAQHQQAPQAANEWDTFMEKFRGKADPETLQFDLKGGGRNPLISMADFNLALGRQGQVGKMKSAFYDYFSGKSSDLVRIGRNGRNDEDEALANMMFVTDSLATRPVTEPANTRGHTIRDITDPNYQPYSLSYLQQTNRRLSDVVFGSQWQQNGQMHWSDYLTGFGCAALSDYLDTDSVPVSLAFPTVERAPMICGVQTDFPGAAFGVTREYAYKDNGGVPLPHGDQNPNATKDDAGQTRTCRQIVTYKVNNQELLRGYMMGNVRALACFPFAHARDDEGNFPVDGRFSLFFTTGDDTISLHAGEGAPYQLEREIRDDVLNKDFGILNAKLDFAQKITPAQQVTREEDALQVLNCSLAPYQGKVGTVLALEGNELLRVEYTWEQTCVAAGTADGGLTTKYEWVPVWENAQANKKLAIDKARAGIRPSVVAGGKWTGKDGDFEENSAWLKNNLLAGGKRVSLRAAVWLRVKDQDGKCVDLVPASLKDDEVQNSIQDAYPLMKVIGSQTLGESVPLLSLNTAGGRNKDLQFEFSIAGLDRLVNQAEPIALWPNKTVVSDPRWNFAPECWYEMNDELTAENWLRANRTGSDGRDADIFMATSDAGYLQSRYEVAFLPRFIDLETGEGNKTSGSCENLQNRNQRGLAQDFGSTANQHLMWRTFDPLDEDSVGFLELPWDNAGTGVKVNPYSDVTNVLMAAFANTPRDWYYASTNSVVGGAKTSKMTASRFNEEYAFNEYSEETPIAWTDLQKVAGRLRDCVRANNGTNWEDAWDEMGWHNDGADRLAGVTLEPIDQARLWSVDRKFLYGFWHDCFAAKQQLYMIFVRAEPMMMGGGGQGQVPPQLGGRAMALVWRDPRATAARNSSGSNAGNKSGLPAPHQTRVLFYRQFE